MVDRLCRPQFSELVTEFTAMSKDPGRYVVMKVRYQITSKAETVLVPLISNHSKGITDIEQTISDRCLFGLLRK